MADDAADRAALDRAEAVHREALAARPDDLEALNNLAIVLGRQGRAEDAIAAYRAAIAAHPRALEPRLNLAVALTRGGRLHDALATYDAVLVGWPDHAVAHFYRANLLAGLEQPEAARVGYDHALALAPDHADAYCNRALVLVRLGDLAAAERDLMAALTRNPQLVAAWQRLVALFQHAGRHADAAAALQRLCALQPHDALPRCRLAQSLVASGDPDTALAVFEQAIALGPAPLPEALRGLASLQLERGNVAEARHNYARAAAAEPVIPWHAASGTPHARVLALVAPGLHNTPVEHLVGASAHQAGMVLVVPGLHYDAAALAQRGDVVLNLISDADVGAAALDDAAALADAISLPTINHPARIRRTDRAAIAGRLADLPGCRVPETVRFARGALPGTTVPSEAQPWLVRPAGDHGGERLECVETPAALAQFVAATAGDAFYLTRFVDYRSADGHYRKYRFIFLGDDVLPYHLAIGDHWKVHYFRTPMDQHDWMRREEAAFLADHTQALDARQCASLAAIRDAIDLEFFGLDCGIATDGALVVFEANASMLVHATDSPTVFPYKQTSFQRIRDAFDRLIEARAGGRVTSASPPSAP